MAAQVAKAVGTLAAIKNEEIDDGNNHAFEGETATSINAAL
jgi:hypothetical protein